MTGGLTNEARYSPAWHDGARSPPQTVPEVLVTSLCAAMHEPDVSPALASSVRDLLDFMAERNGLAATAVPTDNLITL